ncbi:PLP-dependent transferase [Rhypophila sp. PSN 637]
MAELISTRMSAMLRQLVPMLAATSSQGAMNGGDSGTENVIDLSIAENRLLREEMREMVEEAVSDKPSLEKLLSLPAAVGGDLEARRALACFFNTYFNPAKEVLPSHIAITPGAGTCIEALVQSVCDEGDSVLIPAPCWFGFEPYISGRPKVNIVTTCFLSPEIDTISDNDGADDLRSSLEHVFNKAPDPARIKGLLVSNPQNPCSRSYPRDVLLSCLEFCHDHGLHFISDELYALATIVDLSPSPSKAGAASQTKFTSALSIPLKSQSNGEDEDEVQIDASRVHVIWSASKLFGLSGLRFGCLISQDNPSLCSAVSLLTYAGTSSLSATTVTTLLISTKLPSLLSTNSQRLSVSYSILCEGLRRMGVQLVPATEGLFVFARVFAVGSLEEEKQMTARLRQAGLALSPGWLYHTAGGGGGGGNESDVDDVQSRRPEFGWARITIAVPGDVMRHAVARLESFLASL